MKLTNNAKILLDERYFQPNETWPKLSKRVAKAIARVEKTDHLKKKWADQFASIIETGEFIPATPFLMNAGISDHYFSCYVLPVGDSMLEIYRTIANAASIFQVAGGVGYDFSSLRPEGCPTSKTPKGSSSGPISFMKVFDASCKEIKQAGTRRGAQMGILRVDHPDIEKFIDSKQNLDNLTQFNISCAITDKFMSAVKNDEEFDLKFKTHPEKNKTIDARKLWKKIVFSAWNTGEPGLIFIDEINRKDNIGGIDSTNPCSEQPLPPYGCCDLGSIDISKMFNKKGEFEIDRFIAIIPIIVRFLDNAIDGNNYTLPEIKDKQSQERRIGIGVMGFADALIELGISYDSDEARHWVEHIAATLDTVARKASEELAKEKGAFPLQSKSKLKDDPPIRNSMITTIAPTGSISIVAGCSSGIEPIFALVFTRKHDLPDHPELMEVNQAFQKTAIERGFYSEALMNKIMQNNGSCQGIKEVPDDVQKIFKVAADIYPADHVKMLSTWQQFIQSGVSKCIAKGTLVNTSRGVIPIENLGEARNKNQFASALPNTYVKDIEGNWKKIESHYCGGIKPTKKLKFSNGDELEVSTTHKFMGASDEWIRAKNLQIGDYIRCRSADFTTIQTSQTSQTSGNLPKLGAFKTNANKITIPKRLTPELAKWLGMMVANGHTEEVTGFVGLHEKDLAVQKMFVSLSKKCFKNTPKIKIGHTGVRAHYFTSRVLCRWIQELIGYRAHNKHVPIQVLRGPREVQTAFLEGLTFDGFCIKQNKKLAIYYGKSKQLAQEVYSICCGLGLCPYFNPKKVPGYNYLIYGVLIDENILIPIEQHKRKQLRKRRTLVPLLREGILSKKLKVADPLYSSLDTLKMKCRHRTVPTAFTTTLDRLDISYPPDTYLIQVTSIEDGEAEVYDISVEDTHTYLLHNLITHNTINLSEYATEEDVEKVYWQAYETGCKGITVFRDKCRGDQVLNTGAVVVAGRPDILPGVTMRVNTALGKMHITINSIGNGADSKPFEAFVVLSKGGTNASADAEAVGRLVSLALRSNVEVREIVEQLKGIGAGEVAFNNGRIVSSIPDAVAYVLERVFLNGEEKVTHPDDKVSYFPSGAQQQACKDCG